MSDGELLPQQEPSDDTRAKLKAEIIAAGFDEEAAERILTGPPAKRRRRSPVVEHGD